MNTNAVTHSHAPSSTIKKMARDLCTFWGTSPYCEFGDSGMMVDETLAGWAERDAIITREGTGCKQHFNVRVSGRGVACFPIQTGASYRFFKAAYELFGPRLRDTMDVLESYDLERCKTIDEQISVVLMFKSEYDKASEHQSHE